MFEEYINDYIFSGSLPENASTYVKREADDELYEALQKGKFCYVLNSRQSGKSSLRVRTMSRLRKAGVECVSIDLSSISIQSATQENWYADLIVKLIDSFDIDIDFNGWWLTNQQNSFLLRFSNFLENKLLTEIQENIVIFIDEIDSVLSVNFPLDDFFAFIRSCYNQRVDNPKYNRLTFCLLGVASPSNLILDKKRTPFNIGKAITLQGFQLHEIKPLEKGLEGRFRDFQAVLKEILDWTGGQPFLTQKLCQFMVEESEQETPRSVEQVVRSRIIENWESQDEPEHLRTISDRILRDEQRAGYLLELYQQIQLAENQSEITADDTIEQSELLLSGLVVRRQGKLKVYNFIYKEVFNQKWIETQLKKLRPYSENFRFWVASGGKDESRLLRGKALKNAEEWARDKSLNYQDKQFLAASKQKQIETEIAAKDKEAVEKRNKLLADANRKAQWRIRVGTIIFIFTLLLVVSLGIQANKIKDYVQEVERLTHLAEQLENEGSNNIAKELFSQAAQSVNVSNHESRLSLLYLGISFAYQELKNKENKKLSYKYLQASENIIKKNSKNTKSFEDLQIQVLLLKVKGNFHKKDNRKKAIKSYKEAFDLISYYKLSPFNNNLKIKIISKENVEAIHRELIDLIAPNDFYYKTVIESLKNHYLKELENLLINNKWQEANSQTKKIMLLISGRETEGWFDIESLTNFNCEDLRRIDGYWKKYSKDHFGFSVQNNIYNNLNKSVNNFGESVGWYDQERNWINNQYSDLPPNSPTFGKYAKKGHLPFLEDEKNWVGPYIISKKCNTGYETSQGLFITECKVDRTIRIDVLYARVKRCKL